MRNLPRIEKAPTRIEVRPPRKPNKVVVRPRGPALYSQPIEKIDFPGDPPVEFLDPTLHGSASEWWIFAACYKYFNTQPSDGYRRPPFIGEPGVWAYQSWQLGGRSLAGGAVADFEVFAGRRGQSMLLRIQSSRFHLTAGPQVVSYDDSQRERLSEDNRVQDLYEADFVHLRGSDLVKYLADVLAGNQIINPVTAGTYRRSG